MATAVAPACNNPHCDEGSIEVKPLGCEISEKCVAACAAYGRVCPCAARAAGRAAHEKTSKLLADSAIFHDRPKFHEMNADDLLMGEKLGEGGFSNVNSCMVKGDNKSYAVKYLKRKIMVDIRNFQHGAADLATEAFFLGNLNHPNIVALHGVTAGSVESNVSSGKECGFFILVDRLVETLESRIDRWKREVDEQPSSLFYRLSKEYKDKQKSMLHERLQVALDIAKVMGYLHSLRIAYRDLKPDNIGFDEHGVLKLFDFGLAREEKPSERNSMGKYDMTGHTGSRRYMAPEGKCYPEMPALARVLRTVWLTYLFCFRSFSKWQRTIHMTSQLMFIRTEFCCGNCVPLRSHFRDSAPKSTCHK